MIKYTLYFGVPDVASDDFEQFIKNHVATTFDCFTLSCVGGYWKSEREVSATVTIIEDSSKEIAESLRFIARLYNRMFNQECVLLTSEKVYGEFVK